MEATASPGRPMLPRAALEKRAPQVGTARASFQAQNYGAEYIPLVTQMPLLEHLEADQDWAFAEVRGHRGFGPRWYFREDFARLATAAVGRWAPRSFFREFRVQGL